MIGTLTTDAAKWLLGVLLTVATYYVKEGATSTQELRVTVSDLRVIVAELKTSQQSTKDQIATLERRIERLERKDVKPYGTKL